ncbi:MAG TPA: polymer-forming cytoskeletal protein [Rhizomicrobium sp.]|nr:polymer-forming cytoskeletal protein [Rhizomicrobium sp.]
MFSNKTSKDIEVPVVTPPPPSAAPVAQQPRRTQTRGGVPSIISADLNVTGTLSSAGDVQIEGQVDGDVRCGSLVIGEKAFVQGEIVAEEVTIRGRVQGSIRARKIQLCATCHVEGNILHEAFAVEAGAFFEGNCRHSDNPLADDAGTTKTPDFRRKSSPVPADVAAKIEERVASMMPQAVKPLEAEH